MRRAGDEVRRDGARFETSSAAMSGRQRLAVPWGPSWGSSCPGRCGATGAGGEEQGIARTVADDLVTVLEGDAGEARVGELRGEGGALESVVAVEAAAVEGPVLLVEVDHAEVSALDE
jgi:hypothetical protein